MSSPQKTWSDKILFLSVLAREVPDMAGHTFVYQEKPSVSVKIMEMQEAVCRLREEYERLNGRFSFFDFTTKCLALLKQPIVIVFDERPIPPDPS